MTDLVSLALGILLGVWSMRRLEHQTGALLCAHRADRLALVRGVVVRVGAVLLITAALVNLSVTVALMTLIGFWIGRTAYLASRVLGTRQLT